MAYLFHMERSYFSHLCGKYYKAAIKRCGLIFEQQIFYYPHRGAQGPVLTNRKGDSWGRDGEFWICRNKMYLIPLHPQIILVFSPRSWKTTWSPEMFRQQQYQLWHQLCWIVRTITIEWPGRDIDLQHTFINFIYTRNLSELQKQLCSC